MILVFILDREYPNAPHLPINAMFFAADAGLCFTFAMFAVVYSELVNRKLRRNILLAWFALLGLVFWMTPLQSARRVNYEGMNELPMVALVTLTLISGVAVLIAAHYKEKHPYKKIERWLTNLLIVPTMLCIAGSYLFYLYEIDLFQFNYILAIGFLVIFVAAGIKQGALGVKIKIAMLKADASMNAIQSGSSVINHTIKNEIGKIDLLVHQMKQSLQDRQELEGMLDMAADSVQHIQTVMAKIHERVRDVEVKLVKGNLKRIIEQCLGHVGRMAGQDVVIVRQLQPVPDVLLDPAHMKEIIDNILMNALESMEYSGTITVTLMENRREIVLKIQDTGKGIPKPTLPFVFDPFYSTKNTKTNYGLGLYYCKNIMTKHNGSIHVESIVGKGSSFYLYLLK